MSPNNSIISFDVTFRDKFEMTTEFPDPTLLPPDDRLNPPPDDLDDDGPPDGGAAIITVGGCKQIVRMT